MFDRQWQTEINNRILATVLKKEPKPRFEAVLDMYADGVEKLADNTNIRPDIVLCCLPDDVVQTCWSISKSLTSRQRRLIKMRQAEREGGQLFLFQDIEETEEDLLNRDFRRALKARTMKFRMPIQIGTSNLFEDQDTNQDSATRAWNMSVGLYYKGGGIPWRFKTDGTRNLLCRYQLFITCERHNNIWSIQVWHKRFRAAGEGFALRGEAIPWDANQKRNVHLTAEQSLKLADQILQEYRDGIGGNPQRVVLHKTSRFDDAEQEGFRHGFRDIPIVELINIMPTQFRLLTYGTYPPRRGNSLYSE